MLTTLWYTIVYPLAAYGLVCLVTRICDRLHGPRKPRVDHDSRIRREDQRRRHRKK